MASTTADRESALRASLWSLMQHTTLGMECSLDVAGAVASALSLVHATLADFSCQSNRTRSSVFWTRLPVELKLETARWLPQAERTKMLGVSRDVRKLLLSDTLLWTTISLPRRRIPTADRATFAEFLQTMMTRSGSRPLDLEWTKIGMAPSQYSDHVRDVILSVLPRTRTLALCPSFFGPGPQSFWTTPTPLLQKLTISDGTRGRLILGPSSSLKEAPLLQDLTLNVTTSFDTPPLAPLDGVLRLEMTLGFYPASTGWQHLWAWFPRLETLVLHVLAGSHIDPPAIPSPPDSLRHVILYDGQSFPSPERVVREWSGHSVQLLEIFSSAKPALRNAVDFLERCEPTGLWSVSFTHACCPVRDMRVRTVLRGARVTVIIWSTQVWDQCPQIDFERTRTTLTNRVQTLTVSCPTITSMFKDSPTLPNLRALTISQTHGFIESQGPFRAPALERLAMDHSFDSQPDVQLGAVLKFVAGIEEAQGLREITIRLPSAFDPYSPALAKASADLANTAQILTEFASPRRHMDACAHYRPQRQ